MPTFDTPEPVAATISMGAGRLRISASDRLDTVVEVRPSDAFNDTDVQTARETVVEFAAGRLLVRAPKGRAFSLFGGGATLEVTIELPTGSRVDANVAADVYADGRFGDCTVRTANGEIHFDETARLRLQTSDGDVMVRRSSGHADILTANGEIRVREVDGSAVVRSGNGSIALGEVSGELRANTANGDITIDRALASVGAKTAAGDIVLREVVRSSVVIDTSSGNLEIGIREGSAAWLDLHTSYGEVRNFLRAASGPEDSEETVKVRARTQYGDIAIRRP